MNWKAVRRTNDIRRTRKLKRERAEAARKAYIAEQGGPVKLEEAKAAVATLRVEPPAHSYANEREVFTLRGKDWHLCRWNEDVWLFIPFVRWRQDPEIGKGVPVTPSARKWLDGWQEKRNAEWSIGEESTDAIAT